MAANERVIGSVGGYFASSPWLVEQPEGMVGTHRPMAARTSIRLTSSTVSGTYAEPGSGAFRTERTQLIFECRYCGLEIVLDGAQWRHQSTDDAQCVPHEPDCGADVGLIGRQPPETGAALRNTASQS
jgi:hypothetical protein